MIKIAVCDDESKVIESHIKNLEKLKNLKAILWDYKVDIFTSGEELIESETKYDIILLDMEMGDMNGIETGNKIRESDRGVLIIFVTSHSQYMKKSFECQPFQFIVKPVDFEFFKKVIISAGEYISDANPIFIFEENKNVIKILYSDIAYFEKIKHRLRIVMFDGREHVTYMSISQLKKEIDMRIFAVTHKSYIVNMNYIKEIKSVDVELVNKMLVPVSRTYRQELKEKLIALTKLK